MYLLSEDKGLYNIHNLLISTWEVSPCLLDQPFFPSDTLSSLAVQALLPSPELDGLVGTDYGCPHGLIHHHLLARDVSAGSLKQPLVPSCSLLPALILKVQCSPQPQSCVCWYYLQWCDHL